MSLTPDEAELLKQLEDQDKADADKRNGAQAVDVMDHQRVRTDPHPRPFSLSRVGAGAIRNSVQGILDTAEDIGDWLETHTGGFPIVRFGSQADNGVIDVIAGRKAEQYAAKTRQLPTIPQVQGADQAGTAEKIATSILSFMVPFGAYSKAFKVSKAASWLGRAGRVMLAGAATDFTTMDPYSANLASAIKDGFGISNSVLDELAAEPDDSRLEARFKASAVNAPASLLTDAVMEAGLRGVRAYRAWRGTVPEADAAVKSIVKEHLPVEVPAAEEAAAEAPTAAPKAAQAAAKKTATATETAGVRIDTPAENPEDVLDFLKRKTSEGASDEDIANLARVIAEGDPENSLGHLGIDPLKMDWSSLDNPEMLGKLSQGIQGVYEAIAQRLGRTGIRVTEAMTAAAARTLASTADVLKDLYGHTQNLDAIFYASRLIVGAHAQKLVAQATKAMDEMRAGTSGEEWVKFLQDFERHAYYLGALRGAGSEVGRALRQLQHIVKIGRASARETVKDAVEQSAKKALHPDAAKQLAQEATEGVSQIATDAERMQFLGRLMEKSGDIGDLSRFVRASAGSRLRSFAGWLDEALGETRGNLFSAATGEGNAIAGFSLMGLHGLSKVLATLVRLPTAILGKEFRNAATVQAYETWAYVEGGFTGWRGAWSNMWNLLKREGMEEVALNALSFGQKALAKRAQMVAEASRRELKGDFTRVELNAQTRALAMTPTQTKALDDMIEGWNMPSLMEHSMKWMLRAIRPAINAYGSASRLGTILFLNGVDEFVGTMAARAGAQEQAIRIAAAEAGKLGLDGPELRQYLKARMIQLTDTADGFAEDAYSAGQRQSVLAAGTNEANDALFKGKLDLVPLRRLVSAASNTPFLHLIVPFVKTPLRILEISLIDYSPLGIFKDRIRAELLAGGARQDEMLARMGLGLMMAYTGFQLAEDRGIVGRDGGYKSSARVSRPSYSLQVGGDVIEFKRFDPLATLLGWGADFNEALHAQRDGINPADRNSVPMQIFEAAWMAITWDIMDKTWLQSLQSISELASDTQDDPAGATARFLQSYSTRFAPAGSIQRTTTTGLTDASRKTAGFIDGLMSNTFAGTRLPEKRDALGRVIEPSLGQRTTGLNFGPKSDDPLNQEMDRLSFHIGMPRMSIAGARLTPAQYERMLELRGQIVKNPKTGMTMEEALRSLIAEPVYQRLPKEAKVELWRRTMEPYGLLAGSQLLSEDRELAKKANEENTFNQMIKRGYSQEQIDAQTKAFADQLGFTQ